MEYQSGVPRYVQIADMIRRELKGEGERIPSEHELCARFKVSRPTIRQALERTSWNKNRAAALLRLNRTTLVEKLKKRGWSTEEDSESSAADRARGKGEPG